MPDIQTKVEGNVFTLYVKRLNTVYDTFEKKVADYIEARQAVGMSRKAILEQLAADLNNGQAIFKDLLNQATYETDFGLNASYQVAANEQVGEMVKWTLDPEAEHCDSCMAQAAMGVRKMEDVPFPGFQPTIGETNCERYCKCTLEPIDGGADFDKNPSDWREVLRRKAGEVKVEGGGDLSKAKEEAQKLGVRHVDFGKKANPEMVDSLNRAIAEAPGTATPRMVGSISDVEKAWGGKYERNKSGVYGVHIRLTEINRPGGRPDFDGGHVVGINTDNYKSLAEITARKEAVNADYRKRFGKDWSLNTEGDLVAKHEIGHIVYENINESSWASLARRWVKDNPNVDLLKNPEEAFAEAWAAWKGGKRDRLPDYIADFLRGIQ